MSNIVSKGRRTCSIMDELREMKKCLKNQNNTRWNSIYMMLKSFLRLSHSEIESIIFRGLVTKKEKQNAAKNDLTNDEREQVVELTAILEHLYMFTNIIQGDFIIILSINLIRSIKIKTKTKKVMESPCQDFCLH